MTEEEMKKRRQQRLYAICDMGKRLQKLIDEGYVYASDNKIEEMIVESLSKEYANEVFDALNKGKEYGKTPGDFLEDTLTRMCLIRPYSKVWYQEIWNRKDTVAALQNAGYPVTDQRVYEVERALKKELKRKEETKREVLKEKAEELFGKEQQ